MAEHRLIVSFFSLVALAGCEMRDTGNSAGSSTGEASPAVTAPAMPSGTEAAPAPAAAAAPSLGDADSQNGQFRLSVIEASRTGGVLTIKARFTLLGGATGSRRLLHSFDNDDLYVLAGDQKYMMLKDNEGVALAPKDYAPTFAQLGASSTWWGKFPAPPPEVKAVGFYFKDFAPVENVAIMDR
jgi:hypothetical protein